MFIVATICCRGGSKGVKGKNIRLLNGKPLIAYTIETALQCPLINDMIVSTDSEEIADAAKKFGVKKIIERPLKLAADEASKWPVFIHAAENYEKKYGNKIDYLVDLDVTVPLKTKEDIEGAIKFALQNKNADVIITGYEPERNPYFNMMEMDENGFAKLVKQTDQPIVRRQDAPKVFSLTPAAYVIKKEALYHYEHWSKANCMIHEIPREHAIDIDTETDFKLVEFLINERK
jgi:N-acylneuraminate cytidylyltransferase/CMP-N,N'-diacetyllegionaminic acid synthase